MKGFRLKVSVLSIFVGRMMCHYPIRVIFEQIELNNIKFILICCMPCEYIRLRQLNISNMPHALCHLQMWLLQVVKKSLLDTVWVNSLWLILMHHKSCIMVHIWQSAPTIFFFFIDKIYKLILMLPNDLMLPQWHLCVCLI